MIVVIIIVINININTNTSTLLTKPLTLGYLPGRRGVIDSVIISMGV